jgi:hypothetical protein
VWFGLTIREQGPDLAPIAAAADALRALDDVGALPLHSALDGGCIELVLDQHGGQALVRRNALEGDTLRRLEAGCAAVAQLFSALHEPVHLVLRDAEVVLQDAARPERGRLLILGDAKPLPHQIPRLVDAGVLVVGQLRLEKAPTGKDRQREVVEALRTGDQEGRQ